MHSIKCEITYKVYSIDLVQQKIRMENILAKFSKQINKLIKRDWAHMQWTKDNKTNMRKGLLYFIKSGKVNKSKRISYLAKSQNTEITDTKPGLLSFITIPVAVKLITLWQVYPSQLFLFQANLLQESDYGLKTSSNPFVICNYNLKAQ